jgi:hypothetical protein
VQEHRTRDDAHDGGHQPSGAGDEERGDQLALDHRGPVRRLQERSGSCLLAELARHQHYAEETREQDADQLAGGEIVAACVTRLWPAVQSSRRWARKSAGILPAG